MTKALNNIDKYSWPKCTQTTKIVLLKLVSQVSHNLLLKARTKEVLDNSFRRKNPTNTDLDTDTHTDLDFD